MNINEDRVNILASINAAQDEFESPHLTLTDEVFVSPKGIVWYGVKDVNETIWYATSSIPDFAHEFGAGSIDYYVVFDKREAANMDAEL